VRYVASEAMLLLSAILLTTELSMPMPWKTSTLTHKITPTQTHTTSVGEIILISLTETTPFLLMPLNPSLLVFNVGLQIIHLLNNNLLCPSLI